MTAKQASGLKAGDIVWHTSREPGDEYQSVAIIVHSVCGYELTEAQHDGHAGVFRDHLDLYEKLIPVTGSVWDVRDLKITPAKTSKIGFGTMLDYYALTSHRGSEKLNLKKLRDRLPRVHF